MKNKILFGLFILVGSFSLGWAQNVVDQPKELAEVRFGYPRPFSFYYPYNYKFYYPNPHNYGNSGCYWHYTNGAYIYSCY